MSKDTILVVEDDQLLQEVIEEILQLHEIKVKTVGSTIEADDWLEILGVCGLSEITISITKDKKSAASIITNELLFNFFIEKGP